jgi:hypothetical protein
MPTETIEDAMGETSHWDKTKGNWVKQANGNF